METPVLTSDEIRQLERELTKSFTLPEQVFYDGQWITQAEYYTILLAEADAKRTYREYDAILTNAVALYLATFEVK